MNYQDQSRFNTASKALKTPSGPATFNTRGLTFANPSHLLHQKTAGQMARDALGHRLGLEESREQGKIGYENQLREWHSPWKQQELSGEMARKQGQIEYDNQLREWNSPWKRQGRGGGSPEFSR